MAGKNSKRAEQIGYYITVVFGVFAAIVLLIFSGAFGVIPCWMGGGCK